VFETNLIFFVTLIQGKEKRAMHTYTSPEKTG
jgi:hypothetical protein